VRRVTSFVTLPLPAMGLSRMASRLRHQSVDDFDPRSEFEIPRAIDRMFEFLAGTERYAIARGVSLPVGGSLLMVGEGV
jgi:hypothetical protein